MMPLWWSFKQINFHFVIENMIKNMISLFYLLICLIYIFCKKKKSVRYTFDSDEIIYIQITNYPYDTPNFNNYV